MTITSAKLSQLTRWEGNPRKPEPVKPELKANIAAKGVLQPLICRPNGKNTYEVIAGGNRLEILQELVAEGVWPKDRDIPISVRPELEGDDSAALDVAISENLRLPMHPMKQFEAFLRLIEGDKNVTVKTIANTYGVSPRVVEQRLSYAKLEQEARDLVSSDQRDLDWAGAMTLASPDEQKAILSEIEHDPRRYRSAHEVRTRLRDELVPMGYALFDVTKTTAALVRKDLFDDNDGSYMKLSDFMPLQDKAVADRVEALKGDGWSNVSVMSDRDYDPYRYNDGITDKTVGEAILVRYPSGEVIEHLGVSLRDSERLAQISDEDAKAAEALFGDDAPDIFSDDGESVSNDNGNDDAEDSAPELIESARTKKVIAATKAAIAQQAMLENPRLAIVAATAGLVAASGAKIVTGNTSKDLSKLSSDNRSRQAIEDKLDVVREIKTNAGIDPHGTYADIFAKVNSLSDNELNLLHAHEIARHVTSEMPQSGNLYSSIVAASERPLSDFWHPDRGYLETLSKDSLLAVAQGLLPTRLQAKLGKNRPDIVESLAQTVESVRNGESRLGNDEAEVLMTWCPPSLACGSNDGALASIFNSGSDADDSIFLPSNDVDDEAEALFSGINEDDDDTGSAKMIV